MNTDFLAFIFIVAFSQRFSLLCIPSPYLSLSSRKTTQHARKKYLLNKSGDPPHPNPLPPGERGLIKITHLKTPSPLTGEGWGGGEKLQFIELLQKNG